MFAKQKRLALLAATFMTTAVRADFLPENDLWQEDRVLRGSAMTEETFNEVIDEAESAFKNIIAQNFNADFSVNRLWTNSTVNADARQQGKSWVVNMYGGMARRPEISRDGFALVLCHEIGHHLGGYPFLPPAGFFGASRDWAATEGEADYFAALNCSRMLWKNQTAANAEYRGVIPSLPKSLCDAVWPSEHEQNLCYRQMLATKSISELNSVADHIKADFATPSTAIVKKTDGSHPAAQCRMDTYVAGTLCTREYVDSIIPAKDFSVGKRNSPEAELEAGKYSCLEADGFKMGVRPRCWFKPFLVSPAA